MSDFDFREIPPIKPKMARHLDAPSTPPNLTRVETPPLKELSPMNDLTKKIVNQLVGAVAGVIVAKAAANGIVIDPATATGLVLAVYGGVYKALDRIF